MYVFQQIQSEKHGGGLDCGFANMDLVNESRLGLHVTWKFKCKMCNKETVIESENKEDDKTVPINTAAVNGAIASGK